MRSCEPKDQRWAKVDDVQWGVVRDSLQVECCWVVIFGGHAGRVGIVLG